MENSRTRFAPRHSSLSFSLIDCVYKLFAYAFTTCELVLTTQLYWKITLTFRLVPLATLINATQPPVAGGGPNPILSPQGRKRYFVVHGGLFSKDQVTLEDIRKVDRIGRQPDQEGLMRELFPLFDICRTKF